jgi:hypothetical protein
MYQIVFFLKQVIAKQSNEETATEAVRKIFLQATDALPSSTLVHFEHSLFLERHLMVSEAEAVFEMMLQKDCFSAADKQLTTIHQLLFVRRTKGLAGAQSFFYKAFRLPHSSWQLFVVAARIEFFMNRNSKTTRNLFELGMREYGKHVPYLLQYISTLYAMNEETNMRVMFDFFMKDDVLRHSRELWDEYLRFELCYGNRGTIDSVVRARAVALGNAVDPNGIVGSLIRFKVCEQLCWFCFCCAHKNKTNKGS